ncbi:MAG: hypothetical protein ACYCY9_14500 [Thiobacillus sp.]
MPLQELTPEETAFLTAPAAEPDSFQARLTRRLAATLSARLRLPVQMTLQQMQHASPATAPARPAWQPDARLAGVWLTRRLGGQHVMAAIPFVPLTLIHTLDAVLAECWLDAAPPSALPPALAWHITSGFTQATLAVHMPSHPTDMTRWARGAIRHG